MPGGLPPGPVATGRGFVDADAVVAFALATNDPNDLYVDGLAVPPLFTVSLVFPAEHEASEVAHGLIRGATGGIHGEHHARFLGQVLPGMEVQWQSWVAGQRQTSRGVVNALRVEVCDIAGRPLVEHVWSNLVFGGTIDAEFGEQAPDHSFPEDARHRPMGSRTLHVDRDQAFRYAGVTGDRAMHALDDEIARSEGFPGKIVPGLCTFAICSGALVALAADGDPRRLRRLACRFSSPAFPERDLRVDVYDVGGEGDGSHAYAFEAVQADDFVIKHGRADVASVRGVGLSRRQDQDEEREQDG